MRPARKSDVFDAVAHPVRRSILVALKAGERPAGELARPFEMTLPAVAQHLKVLREAKLVNFRREGQKLVYYLDAEPLRAVLEWVEEFGNFWNEKLDALERHLDDRYGREPRDGAPMPRGGTRRHGKRPAALGATAEQRRRSFPPRR